MEEIIFNFLTEILKDGITGPEALVLCAVIGNALVVFLTAVWGFLKLLDML